MSKVTITFDGLLLFSLKNKLCEIKVNTAAKAHVMKITVESGGRMIDKEILCAGMLKLQHPLDLFIDSGSGKPPVTPSVADNGKFNKILNLADQAFYKRPRPIKPNTYDCSINLHDGVIGAGVTDTGKCKRVKNKIFPALKFLWETEDEFNGFERGVKALDSEAIIELPASAANFARDVVAEITLAAGQSLRLLSAKTNVDIVKPLTFGADYDVRIDYADVDLPDSLTACQGFAHHCEALMLDEGEPVFGLFMPSFRKSNEEGHEEESGGILTLTRPGCCECGRMDP